MGNTILMAQRIHDKRIECGYTMEELGNIVGVQKSAVNKWEKGIVSNMKRSVIEKLAEIFGCSPTWLMGMDEEEDNYYIDDEAREMAQFLLDNPEYKVLFDASRKVKPEDLQKALKAIGLFIDED